MELKFKNFFLILICSTFFYGFSSAQATEDQPSAPTADAMAMLEERFASLSGSLGKMTTPPKLSGTLSLPPDMSGKIQLPGDGIAPQQQQLSKENES